MKVTTLGIDLAKSIFQLHGVDAHGKVALQKRVTRAKVWETIAQLPPCLNWDGSVWQCLERIKRSPLGQSGSAGSKRRKCCHRQYAIGASAIFLSRQAASGREDLQEHRPQCAPRASRSLDTMRKQTGLEKPTPTDANDTLRTLRTPVPLSRRGWERHICHDWYSPCRTILRVQKQISQRTSYVS